MKDRLKIILVIIFRIVLAQMLIMSTIEFDNGNFIGAIFHLLFALALMLDSYLLGMNKVLENKYFNQKK